MATRRMTNTSSIGSLGGELAAAARLAIVLSAAAVLLTVVLRATGEASTLVLVSGVAAVGFMTSWVQSGRFRPAHVTHARRRVAVIPVRHRVS